MRALMRELSNAIKIAVQYPIITLIYKQQTKNNDFDTL